MKNITNKIGVGILSTFLLGSCATQKYSGTGSLMDNKDYAMTKDILKEESRDLNKLERKYNQALKNGATVQSPGFLKLLQDYEYQKSIVQNYQDILKLFQKK